ncbi:hypothetical protein KC19_10G148800 [Ceratodon purpureus]|uniref:Uncharacterized protein n=1 Tax=Ceratodon purpureus TaxID=3225 RepID=A0A8T0GLZ3_CERPU|nr:hypothetical protein KC19_10G148800 [Ceratodon purpureus]
MVFFLVSLCGDLLSTVTRPWRQLFWLVLHLYVSVCTIVLNRIAGAYLRCMEVVTAYRRERELVVRLDSVRRDYDDLKSRNSELEKKLDAYTRDRQRILETLDLVTDDKKKAMETVRFLKKKVQDLEFVIQQFAEIEEVQRRGLANTVATLTAATKLHAKERSFEKQDSWSKLSLEHNKPLEAKDYASKTAPDVLIKNSYLESDEMWSLMTSGVPSSKHLDVKDLEVPLIVEDDQGVAFISSVFSALMSTLVAMIAWEAKDPCTPLVVALFIVVGMSMANVVRFFNKIQTHQGFLAVGLLSLNWFMLGTLAHPALPYLGKMWTGIIWFFGHRFVRLLGFGSVIRVKGVTSSDEF